MELKNSMSREDIDRAAVAIEDEIRDSLRDSVHPDMLSSTCLREACFQIAVLKQKLANEENSHREREFERRMRY